MIFHSANNAWVVALLAQASTQAILPAKPLPPFKASPELVACASSPEEKAQLTQLERVSLPVLANNLAWRFATDPKASDECQRRAEELTDLAMTGAPGRPGYLDTRATVLFREGRIDEAVDLEAAALELQPDEASIATQLDRFVRKRAPSIVRGQAELPALSMHQRWLDLDFGAGMPYGGSALIRIAAPGAAPDYVWVVLGPGHPRTHQVSIVGQPEDAAAEVAFLDARGCMKCAPGSLKSTFLTRAKEVDSYP